MTADFRSWAPLLAALRGHTMYVVELPGMGLTDPVPFDHRTIRATAVAHLGGVLDALGLDGCPFVTHSMGSLWTVWLAAEQAERMRSQVMVACPACLLDSAAPLPMRLMSVPGLGRLMQAQPPSPTSVERIVRMVGEDPEGLTEICDALLAAQRMPPHSASVLTLMRALMRWTRPRPEVVVDDDQLRAVAHPVRLIWGKSDRFGSTATARRTAELVPDADLHLVPGGHAPWLHHAEDVAALTREFLDHH